MLVTALSSGYRCCCCLLRHRHCRRRPQTPPATANPHTSALHAHTSTSSTGTRLLGLLLPLLPSVDSPYSPLFFLHPHARPSSVGRECFIRRAPLLAQWQWWACRIASFIYDRYHLDLTRRCSALARYPLLHLLLLPFTFRVSMAFLS